MELKSPTRIMLTLQPAGAQHGNADQKGGAIAAAPRAVPVGIFWRIAEPINLPTIAPPQ